MERETRKAGGEGKLGRINPHLTPWGSLRLPWERLPPTLSSPPVPHFPEVWGKFPKSLH